MNNREYTCKNYVIKAGDSLYGISREYNVPLPLILRLNPFMDIYNLQVGDELCIPVMDNQTNQTPSDYVIEDQDSMQTVMDKFNMTLDDLLKYNNLDDVMLLPGTTIKVPMTQS